MRKVRIKVENVAKRYRLGEIGTGTLSHDLNRFWAKLRGKEDPASKIGAENDRTKKTSDEYVLALSDINFEVKEGEVLGIIGRNGAGKSTLLKVLSKVTGPTSGRIKVNGRIGSLLEVGTGMHPELTGIENIYLNGAILGMTKKEVSAKIEEIIDFAGIAKYADTPFKRYSSGMRVRLGFAVAAFLEPEILIVDEVLAVGDAEFQKRAIGKMQEVSQGQGRTVLFVSHNMASIEKLCNRAILLDNGKVVFSGSTEDAITRYREQVTTTIENFNFSDRKFHSSTRFTGIDIVNLTDEKRKSFSIDDPISLRLHINSAEEVEVYCRIALFDINESRILAFDSKNILKTFCLKKRDNQIVCTIAEGLELKPGQYYVNISLKEGNRLLDHVIKATAIIVEPSDYYKSGRLTDTDIPLVLKRNSWDLKNY